MTYDLYGSWTNKIGHHSALFHRRGEKGMERELNTVRSNGKIFQPNLCGIKNVKHDGVCYIVNGGIQDRFHDRCSRDPDQVPIKSEGHSTSPPPTPISSASSTPSLSSVIEE
jgi:hypothetical protein